MIAPDGVCFFKHLSCKTVYRTEIKIVKFWFWKAKQVVGRVVVVCKKLSLVLGHMLESQMMQTQRLCTWDKTRLHKNKEGNTALETPKRCFLQPVHWGLSGHELEKLKKAKLSDTWWWNWDLSPQNLGENFPQNFSYNMKKKMCRSWVIELKKKSMRVSTVYCCCLNCTVEVHQFIMVYVQNLQQVI